MFVPKTEKIENLAKQYPEIISRLEKVFIGKTNLYIDYANVVYWQKQLGWDFDMKRMKQFFDSFDNIDTAKIYFGTLEGDANSESFYEIFK